MIKHSNKLCLCIDVGNTNTVFAIHDGKEFLAQWRTLTVSARTSDQYFVWLQQLMYHKRISSENITSGIIGSVVPTTLYNLRQMFAQYFDADPYIVGSNNCKLDVDILLDIPAEIGADRLVNAIGAYNQYGDDLIIIDFGTATTFDVVGAQGSYHGGVIAPGINLSIKALHEAAARLPTIEICAPPNIIAKNTVHAMQSGVYWGYISLIEGICARIQTEWGRPMHIIATGGLAPLFSGGTSLIETVDQDLTITGLYQIFEQQKITD